VSEKEAGRLRRAVVLMAAAQRYAQDAARRVLSGQNSYDAAETPRRSGNTWRRRWCTCWIS
jgi:hypothetical protein